MSSVLRCGWRLLAAHRRPAPISSVYSIQRGCSFYAKPPYKPIKGASLTQQSVLLPGEERIRSSNFLEGPQDLVCDIPGAEHIRTAYEVLDYGLQVSGDGDCIGTRKPGCEEYEWKKYSEVIQQTKCIGSGLIELGLRPQNDTFIGIFAANREEFLITMYATAGYSMVLVPLYITLGVPSILFIINQVNLPLIFVNNAQNVDHLLSNRPQVPSLHTIVMMDTPTTHLTQSAKEKDIRLITFAELEALGKKSPKDLVLPKPEDLFCIPYTSGTTGVPKGVMITHKNLMCCVSSVVIGYGEAGLYGGTIISYLPPAHIYEIVNEVASLYFARRIAFYSGDIKLLMEEVRRLKPSILPLVPRLMNAIYMKVMESTKGSFLKTLALKTAVHRKEKLLKKGQVTNQSIWDRLILRPFQEALGGEAHLIITTSAPISPEVMRFFRCASGAHVFEAYGQTEVMAATMTLPLEYRGGYVGAPLPCNLVKLKDVPEMNYFAKDDIGEICVKGPNVFQGYFKKEEITKESLIESWQHTGDIGKWLPNGALQVIDRKKHIFKLSQGEYIAPEKVENVYGQSKLVAQVLVDGFSDKNFAIALVVPEIGAFTSWLKYKGYQAHDNITEIVSKKDVRRDFLQELHKLGTSEQLISLEQAKNMAILLEPFSVENELLTPTLKVKRNFARSYFDKVIHQLYEEGALV